MKRSIFINILLTITYLLCYSQAHLFTSWEQDTNKIDSTLLDTISLDIYIKYDSLFINNLNISDVTTLSDTIKHSYKINEMIMNIN
ncbi:MAG TPA: hypothetical protein DEO38_03765 [Bacteroidales bacterium]|nr:hypothetical protein [Bacteroidales bacterium]